MKYAKLIDNYPVYAPNPIIVGGRRKANPKPELLFSMGYRPVYYGELPECPEGYHYTENWSYNEQETEIWCTYGIEPDTPV